MYSYVELLGLFQILVIFYLAIVICFHLDIINNRDAVHVTNVVLFYKILCDGLPWSALYSQGPNSACILIIYILHITVDSPAPLKLV